MSLMPTLRSKKRYLVFTLQICDTLTDKLNETNNKTKVDKEKNPFSISTNSLELKEFIKALNSRILYLYGVVGASEIDARLLKNYYFSNEGKGVKGIVRCNAKYVEKLRYALITIDNIEGKKVSVDVVGVSGTIKSATSKYLYPLGLLKNNKKTH